MGFGFDEMNIKNLGLDQIRSAVVNRSDITNTDYRQKFRKMKDKRIYITNYAKEENVILSEGKRRFSPRIISIIKKIFVIDEMKGSSDSSFFLEGKSKSFEYHHDLVLSTREFEVYISGLSVEKAIDEDFLI